MVHTERKKSNALGWPNERHSLSAAGCNQSVSRLQLAQLGSLLSSLGT